MKYTYYYEFIYEYMAFNGKTISNFIDQVTESFVPYSLFGYNNEFNQNSINEINSYDFKSKALLINEKGKSALNIYSAFQNRLNPRKNYTVIRFLEKPSLLTQHELYYFINIEGFKVGFLTKYLYNFYQSTDNPANYLMNKLDHSKLPKYYNEILYLELIDISQNLGRERFLPGMKFIPGYKIWYGKESQELFGREKILNYKNAVHIKELENDVIEMQLMDDISKCDNKKNMKKQKDLIKYLQIDKLEVSKY